MYKLILNLVLVQYISGNILLPTLNTFHSNELANFAAKTYHNFCQYCRMSMVVYDQQDLTSRLFLAQISKSEFNMSYVLLLLTQNEVELRGANMGDVAEMTLLFLSKGNCENMKTTLKKIESIFFWSKYSKIILVVTGMTTKDINWIEETFKYFWAEKILRVLICFWLEDQINVYTFDPFINNYSQDITNVSTTKMNDFLEHELFDLYGYPLKTFVYDVASYKQRISKKQLRNYIGLDGKFLTEVRNILNVTLDLTRESEAKIVQKFFIANHNRSNSFPKLFLDVFKYDIFFTALRTKLNANVDYVFLHERDDVCVVVPKGLPVPQYLYMFLIVPAQMWFGTCVSLIIVALVLVFLFDQLHGVLEAFAILISAPLVAFSEQKRKLKDRLVYASWLLFALIFGTAFQCTLTSTLVSKKFYPDIDTMEDLAKTNLTIHASIFEKELLTQNLQIENEDLLNRLVVHIDTLTLEKMLSATTEYDGFMVRGEIAREFIKLAVSHKDQKPLYHIMLQHPIPSAQGYAMPKGHPYHSEILWISHKIHESGLYWYWRQNDFGWATDPIGFRRRRIDGSTGTTNHFISLTVNHLQSSFYLLALGLLIAVCVFCFEFRKRKHK